MVAPMASCFTSWTVLPHQPIEKLAGNLWRVTGKMPDGKTQRQMVLAKLADGRVVVHNAIALADDEMAELEAWGEPAVIFVPNGYHRQDAAIWKQRYAKARVIAPAGARKRVAKVVEVDATTADAPGDAAVRLTPLEGLPAEGVLEVRGDDGGVTLVFCDAVLNEPPLGFPMGFLLAPTGKVSSPRVVRWFLVKDKRALAAQLDGLADTPGLSRLLFGHGEPVTADCPATLRAVAAQLRG